MLALESSFRADLEGLDRETFDVSERDGRFLIKPKKSKTTWLPGEERYRSLLVDAEGRVLSCGFPKFWNYGENADDTAAFEDALRCGRPVTWTEKRDGSLICATRIEGEPHLRTRGNHDLGDFEGPVRALIESRYPRLLTFLSDPRFAVDSLCLLLEYTAPENRIVVEYDEPELHLLAVLDKDTRSDVSDEDLREIAAWIGVPLVAEYNPTGRSLPEILETIRAWEGEEGIVARFRNDAGEVRRIKIKSEQYVRLHALKYRLAGKVSRLAYLLGIESLEEAPEILGRWGIDFEAREFIAEELKDYLERLDRVKDQFVDVMIQVATLRWLHLHRLEGREKRKEFVTKIRRILSQSGYVVQDWFPITMKLYEDRPDDASSLALATQVLCVSVHQLRLWDKDRESYAREMFSTPVPDDG